MGGRGSGGSRGGGGSGNAVSAKMPELVGSPKQIAWAEDIRRQALSDVDRLRTNYELMKKRAPDDKKFAEDTLGYNLKDVSAVQEFVIETLRKVTSAKQFIDGRERMTGRVIEKMAREIHQKAKRK